MNQCNYVNQYKTMHKLPGLRQTKQARAIRETVAEPTLLDIHICTYRHIHALDTSVYVLMYIHVYLDNREGNAELGVLQCTAVCCSVL